MNKTIKIIMMLLLLAMLLIPSIPAYAQSGDQPGKIIFGDNFTLKSGEQLNGDLVVIGGNVTIEDGAKVKGSLVVVGGTISSTGSISGDVVVIGGQAQLHDKAVVSGDVVTIGGQLNKATGAVVSGEVVDNVAPPKFDVTKNVPQVPSAIVRFNPFLEFGKVMGASIFVAVLGMLATLFFQPRLDRVSQAVVAQPLMVSSMGLLTFVALILLAVTIILLPFALLGLIPLALAWLFGVIAIGQEVGGRFARALQQNWAPVLTTGIGTFAVVFLVTFVDSMNNLLPLAACVTWIIPVLVGLAAVGAVVMTRFGARPVQIPHPPVAPPPLTSEQLPPSS